MCGSQLRSGGKERRGRGESEGGMGRGIVAGGARDDGPGKPDVWNQIHVACNFESDPGICCFEILLHG